MGDRIRILMIAACPFPAGRGTPVRILRMAEGLAGRGHSVDVATYHLGTGPVGPGVTVHRIPDAVRYRRYEPGPTWQKLLVLDPLVTAKVAGLLRSRPVDVVHAHHAEGLLVGLIARGLRRVPIVYDVHTVLEAELPFYAPRGTRAVMARVGRVFDRYLPRSASALIVAHDDIRRRLGALDPTLAPRIAVAPSGAELDRFARTTRRTDGSRTLVYTGNLASYQGIDLMLRAFAELRGRRDDVRLRIVADSPFTPYEPLAAELGVRHAIDLVPADFETVPGHLSDAAVALHPRTSCDGLPQKLVNYMAAGAPIVAFRGSAKELAHGEHGWVVADGDCVAFAEGIDRLLRDPGLAHRLGANARAYAERALSWERTAEQVEAVYRRILA